MKTTTLIMVAMLCVGNGYGAALSVADLVCPCRVTFFDIYLDGGTLGGRIEDSGGAVLGFCLDGRMQEERDPGKGPMRAAPRLFYVGAEHPNRPGARVLQYDGAEERMLLAKLEAWVETVMPGAAGADAVGAYGGCKTAQQRVRFIQANGYSAEQERALWVGAVVRARREQAEDAGH